MPREEFMRLAIEKAREGVAKGQWPYGACVVKGDEMVSCAHNVSRATLDPTAHAEIEALREACINLKSPDLTGCEIYATSEPCPMCFTACHHAGVSTIIYAANAADSPTTGRRRRVVPSSQMKEILDSPIQIVGGLLRAEAIQLFT